MDIEQILEEFEKFESDITCEKCGKDDTQCTCQKQDTKNENISQTEHVKVENLLCKLNCLDEDYVNPEFTELEDKYVPDQGHCDTLGGELIRCIQKLNYRYFNDGDMIGVDYGNETCNAPAFFLEEFAPTEIKRIINYMIWDDLDKDTYKQCLLQLENKMVNIVKSGKYDYLFEPGNTKDMYRHANVPTNYGYNEDDEDEPFLTCGPYSDMEECLTEEENKCNTIQHAITKLNNTLKEQPLKEDEETKLTWEQAKIQVEQALNDYKKQYPYLFKDGAIEMYVDYNDDLDDNTITEIFQSDLPLQKYYEVLDEGSWDSSEEYTGIFNDLNLPEEIKDEFRNEIYDYLIETVPVIIPYEHYNETVGFDVFLNNSESANIEYADELIEYNSDEDSEESIATNVSGEIAKLLQLQGHTVEEFLDYVNGKGTENKFFKSLKNEIDECTNDYGNQIVFFVQAPIMEMAKAIQDKQTITILKSSQCGLISCGNGSGSVLDIELEKDITGAICDITKPSYQPRDGVFEVNYKHSYRYNADEIYGLVNSAWETDVVFNTNESVSVTKSTKHTFKETENKKQKTKLVTTYECDGNKHQIVRNTKGKYQNRYFVNEDNKAKSTTKGVDTLPTAVGALMKRFPKAIEIK